MTDEVFKRLEYKRLTNNGPMKPYITFFSLVLIFVLSCQPSFHDQYYKKIQGSWRISDFQHINGSEENIIDLRIQDGYYLMVLEKHNHLFFVKRDNRRDISVSASYEIFKENDILKIRIEKSDDKKIEGVYDFYIDTLSQTNMHYKLLISLNSENTYLSALRMKSKPHPQ